MLIHRETTFLSMYFNRIRRFLQYHFSWKHVNRIYQVQNYILNSGHIALFHVRKELQQTPILSKLGYKDFVREPVPPREDEG